MRKIALQPPKSWPERGRQLYHDFCVDLSRRIRTARAHLLQLAPLFRFQSRKGLSYRDFPRWLWDRHSARLTPHNRYQCWLALRHWLKFLYKRLELLHPLHTELGPAPKRPSRPRRLLSYEEILHIFKAPDLSDAEGIRDRAMLEVAYATALRTGELLQLDLKNVDLAERKLFLTRTKMQIDRIVPLGKWATYFLERYLREARPQFASPLSLSALWLGKRGQRFSKALFYRRIREIGRDAKIPFTAYLLRHACATHMLRNGASIRQIQELLGHRSLSTTQIYTRLFPDFLSEVHRRHHPRNHANFYSETESRAAKSGKAATERAN